MAERACPGCRQLQRRVAEWEALVRDLQARRGSNASNASLPPSATPPAAPKPVVQEPTGRTPGGQPGHAPCPRTRLPAERLAAVVRYLPTACRCCQAPVPAEPGPGDPEPTWHQVAALPEVTARITEHQGHTRENPQTFRWPRETVRRRPGAHGHRPPRQAPGATATWSGRTSAAPAVSAAGA